jgi:hypothetical protein
MWRENSKQMPSSLWEEVPSPLSSSFTVSLAMPEPQQHPPEEARVPKNPGPYLCDLISYLSQPILCTKASFKQMRSTYLLSTLTLSKAGKVSLCALSISGQYLEDVCICLCIRCILDLGSVTMDKVNSVSMVLGFLSAKCGSGLYPGHGKESYRKLQGRGWHCSCWLQSGQDSCMDWEEALQGTGFFHLNL